MCVCVFVCLSRDLGVNLHDYGNVRLRVCIFIEDIYGWVCVSMNLHVHSCLCLCVTLFPCVRSLSVSHCMYACESPCESVFVSVSMCKFVCVCH